MLTEINANDTQALKAWLENRTQPMDLGLLEQVTDILEHVKEEGNRAIRFYTRIFDHKDAEVQPIPREQLETLAASASADFRQALEGAAANITAFHQAQKQNSYILTRENGVYLGQRVLPLEAVGIYVPGGRARYPSSVLMNAIPAKVAGVKRIVMVTPPNEAGTIDPELAAAALTAGVTEIWPMGGAQAIGALAYGTETMKPVDKIVGPGNIYVAAAKKLVYGKVDIDMIAGPSEILVIADEGADPAWIAADLLSQAEHDPMASAIFLCTSQDLLEKVNGQLEQQMEKLPKKEIVLQSLEDYGRAVVCDSVASCIAISNAVAPEHLELMVQDPMEWLGNVQHAGSVFLGYHTCESIGDYYGGTNHVLPTSGTARFSSPLGVDAFIKKSSFLHYTPAAVQQDGSAIVTLAEAEQLQAHANAVKVRL